MLQNLLANALRYTDRGQVTLSCVPRGAGRALIEVSDTGIGIGEAIQARIFEDFFQAAAHGDGHRGGAGLGLGIVRRLSSLLSIPVQVSSVVGVGTRFSLEVSVLERSCGNVPDRCDVAAHRKGQAILLIEDDRSMRNALCTYLKLDDHTVYAAGSLTELAEIIGTLLQPPDIVISDFQLGPTERGSEAIERTRVHFKCNVPAILLTGDTSAVPARLSSEAGIRMLSKPVDAERLVSLIDELLLRGAEYPRSPEQIAAMSTGMKRVPGNLPF
jgi:CheY-like chemotaxis protein